MWQTFYTITEKDNCITGLYAHTLPDIPAGYEYDFIDPYGFVHDIKMDKKCLLAPSGRKYSILILGENTKVMSLKVLKKIASLVEEGVAVLGREPIFRGSNLDNADEFKALVTSIWHTNRKKRLYRYSYRRNPGINRCATGLYIPQ